MRKHFQICALGLASGMILAACNDDKHTVPPSTVTAGVGFEAFVQTLVEINTCDKSEPPDTNTSDFTYASDQDSAQPRDLSTVAPACTI